MQIVEEGLGALASVLGALGAQRVLLITGGSSRFLERVRAALPSLECFVYDGARRHVPEAVLSEAQAKLRECQADTLLTLGGGSAIGLGKALRLTADVRFVAIPTTYSGSEHTNVYGTTRTVDGQASKVTGKDDRVRPDVVVYDRQLLADMPRKLTVTSLMNAAAHAVGVLAQGDAPEARRARALLALDALFAALEALVRAPRDANARAKALAGAGAAASLAAESQFGFHHKLAHLLGGAFDLDHAALHSVLLPHTLAELRRQQPERLQQLESKLGIGDIEAAFFDLLRRAQAATSLRELSLSAADFERVIPAALLPEARAYYGALHGVRPSCEVSQQEIGLSQPVAYWGAPLATAERVVVALHGRGSDANSIIQAVRETLSGYPGVAVLAPQAERSQWYNAAYNEPPAERESELSAAVDQVERVLTFARGAAPKARLALFGFSQGACLALEVLNRTSHELDVVVALSGARAWSSAEPEAASLRKQQGVKLLLGISEGDPSVRVADVEMAAQHYAAAGCSVTLQRVPGDEHRLHAWHRSSAGQFLTGMPRGLQRGFGGVFETEALPSALPQSQNSPRLSPYGLYPEQINGSGFTVQRHHNLRSWMYRIRPAAQQTELRPLAHATFNTDFVGQAPEPNLSGWMPMPFPSAPTDFMDGITTLGGAGDPNLRRGYAIHWYALNRSMEDRAFCNADGDLLLVPESGELLLLTESGVLELCVGKVAVLPRGIRFSVIAKSPVARGFIGEIYGRHFELAERGPIGANGLADARHFQAPTAWFEDSLRLGYRVTAKFGGALYEATQDYSPYDVVAWHGNYTPYVYDLAMFVPAGNTRVDHGDPSVYSVLSSALDEAGTNLLDFIIFPPRWDSTEHTFRPPFFHRNATMEINGVLRNQALQGLHFEPGCCFITPSMTPHGVLSRGVEHAFALEDAVADRAMRHPDDSLWFQFESALPLQLSRAARTLNTRILDWSTHWGAYRTHFRPTP